MSRARAVVISIVSLLIILAIIVGIKGEQINFMIKSGESFQQPPTTVAMYDVGEQVWPRSLMAVGTLEAEQGLTLRAEISGRINAIHFEGGQQVNAGDVLVEQESGNEQAQLRAAKARLTLAESSLNRLIALRKQQSVSESAIDEARQQLESAKGDVDNLTTTLAKKRIVAPFSGRLGLKQVYLGQDLQAGTAVVSLQAVDSLKVNFNIPQKWLNQVKPGYIVNVTTRQGETVSGEVIATAAEIDPMTRNLTVQARIPNAEQSLLPGLAVDVEVELPNPQTVLAVPATAILFAPYGDTVFVVEDNNGQQVVRQQFVRLGESRGDYVAVEVGLQAGQRIVRAGGFKLFNGMPVVEGKNPEPALSLNPQPNDA